MKFNLAEVETWAKSHKAYVAVGGVALVAVILYARHRANAANAAASDTGATTADNSSDGNMSVPEDTSTGYPPTDTTGLQQAISGLTTSVNNLDPTVKGLTTAEQKQTKAEHGVHRATDRNTKATKAETKADKHHPAKHPAKHPTKGGGGKSAGGHKHPPTPKHDPVKAKPKPSKPHVGQQTVTQGPNPPRKQAPTKTTKPKHGTKLEGAKHRATLKAA